MKITIESTSQVNTLSGLPARLWEGETAWGIKISCWITRIAVDHDEPRVEEFERELQEVRVPSVDMQGIPLRLIL